MKDDVFVALQRLTPHHTLSRLIGLLAHSTNPWVKNTFIQGFVDRYQPNMNEALVSDPLAYPSFNAFFTRELKEGARPICASPNSLACPADGAISQLGTIQDGSIFQAKGHEFQLSDLLGGSHAVEAELMNGKFMTVYLSPKDYHRVHIPAAATLTATRFVPGRLFSVNPVTTSTLPRLFARNERLVCIFETDFGPMVVVLVGAMIVASIKTVWSGVVAPLRRKVSETKHNQSPIQFEKGDEIGQFLLGSTAIVLLPSNVELDSDLKANSKVHMGQSIGSWQR